MKDDFNFSLELPVWVVLALLTAMGIAIVSSICNPRFGNSKGGDYFPARGSFNTTPGPAETPFPIEEKP